MAKQLSIDSIAAVLKKHDAVVLAYVHGSVLHSQTPGDVDVAVFLNEDLFNSLVVAGDLSLGFIIPLEMEIEQAIGFKTDLQVLNRAPLTFCYRVIKGGTVILDRQPGRREEFECSTMMEYFDFRPKREEYLAETAIK